MVEFRGVRIADEEIVYCKGEGSGVCVVAKNQGGGSFGETMLGEKSDKTKLG